MFDFFHQSQKLLGMNARNLDFVRPFNRRRGMRIADQKLLCKRILTKAGLPVSPLIGRIRNREELEHFNWTALPSSFALKPNRGFGGEGILVVYGRKKNRPDVWIKANGGIVTIEDLKTHIINILDGSFSLSNTPDVAFFEERLKLLKLFKPYTYKGIPDIRVIIFNRIPVMAMLRLPTKASDGKANLQQGAIGVGIDLATGTTTSAIIGKGQSIDTIPGTNLSLSGIKIPHWKQILTMAVDAQEVSSLGFLGADIAIDRERGPVILELNARPGLSIQLANSAGLKERLNRVRGIRIKTTERGVRLGRNLFGGEIEEEIEEISGRRVIGPVEKVKLIGKNGKEIEVSAKIDTGADSTSIDTALARELGFGDMLDTFQKLIAGRNIMKELTKEERERLFSNIPDLETTIPIRSSHGVSYRPVIHLNLIMDTLTLSAKVSVIDRSHLEYPIIIGRKNLGKFLVDVNK